MAVGRGPAALAVWWSTGVLVDVAEVVGVLEKPAAAAERGLTARRPMLEVGLGTAGEGSVFAAAIASGAGCACGALAARSPLPTSSGL